MRRYTYLLLTAFVLVVAMSLGSLFLSGHADQTRRPAIRVYTTMPAEQAGILAAEYESESHVPVEFVPLSPVELSARLKAEGKKPDAAMVLADSAILRQAAMDGVFVPYVTEQTDQVADELKDADGAWVGAWYDPVVFCANSDYLRTLPRIPQTWTELADYPNVRLGMTDFLAADAASNLYFSLLTAYGEPETFRMLSAMQPKVVQYVKYLSTPVRMAGMGEVDISLAVQSETLRYMNKGYPLKIIYPTDGTAYMLTGLGLLRDDQKRVYDFAAWLLSDRAHQVLQEAGVYFVPTDPETLAYKMLAGKNLTLFEKQSAYTKEERQRLLDLWLREIRFR